MLTRSEGELYIQIAPLRTSDHNRVIANKYPPIMRLKVSDSMPLSAISNYVSKLVGADAPTLTIALHVPYRDTALQLPLTMSVAQIRAITGQSGDGDLRYSFTQKITAPPLYRPQKLPIPKKRIPEQPPQQITYPVPARQISHPSPPKVTPPLPDLNESFTGYFSPGLAPWSNSFGMGPPYSDLGGPRFGLADPGNSEETISLMEHLQLEL
jgi:hypothetical protein